MQLHMRKEISYSAAAVTLILYSLDAYALVREAIAVPKTLRIIPFSPI